MNQFLVILNNFKIILIALLVVPTLIYLYNLGYFWIKRWGLAGKLARFCHENGFELTWLRDPLESAKTRDCKFDFTVKANDKTYHVAILSARHRLREHHFASFDTLHINQVFQMKRISQRNRYRKPKHRTVSLGVATNTIPINLDVKVPDGEEKILLFYPVAKEVSCMKGGKKQYMESGSEIYKNFYLFSLSCFMKQLTGEKNYIEKKKIWQYD